MNEHRKPEYQVKALDKNTGKKASIGGAWLNKDGTIAVILDNFINLHQTGNLLITLFPSKNLNSTPAVQSSKP